MERRDKLGRRIPEFDRSAAIKKGNETKKEKYGPDFHKRISAMGGSHRKRGYFGELKDAGKEDELKRLSRKGVVARSHKVSEDEGETLAEKS
jgi:hypothetical protein